jgi:hypothetical protein
MCEVVQPAPAAAASHVTDDAIARHMNALKPDVIVDLHGFM